MDTEVSVSTPEKKIRPSFLQDSNPRPFNRESGVLTTYPVTILCVVEFLECPEKSHMFCIVPVKLPLF